MNLCKPPSCLTSSGARTYVEMIGVAEQDLTAHLLQISRQDGLDRSLRPDGHKARRLNHAVSGF